MREAVVLRFGETDPSHGQAEWEVHCWTWRPVADGVGWTSSRENPGEGWGRKDVSPGHLPRESLHPLWLLHKVQRRPHCFQGSQKMFQFLSKSGLDSICLSTNAILKPNFKYFSPRKFYISIWRRAHEKHHVALLQAESRK